MCQCPKCGHEWNENDIATVTPEPSPIPYVMRHKDRKFKKGSHAHRLFTAITAIGYNMSTYTVCGRSGKNHSEGWRRYKTYIINHNWKVGESFITKELHDKLVELIKEQFHEYEFDWVHLIHCQQGPSLNSRKRAAISFRFRKRV